MTSTNLSKLDSVIARQQRRGVDIRPTLLRMLTDVYVATVDPTQADEAQYVEIALRLIDEVDAETRQTVIRRLRDCSHAPRALLDRIAGSGSLLTRETAGPIGAGSPADRDDAVGRRFFIAGAAERRQIIAELGATVMPPPVRDF